MTFEKLTGGKGRMQFISIGTRRVHVSSEMMKTMFEPENVEIEYDCDAKQIKFFQKGMWKITRLGNQMPRICVSLNKLMPKGKYVYKSTTEDGGFIFEKSIE